MSSAPADGTGGDDPANDNDGDGNGNGGAPVDGVWDASFGKWAGIVTIALAALLIVGLATLGLTLTGGKQEVVKATEWVDGSFADRGRFFLALVLMGLGGLLLLVTGYLAALEVRARLTAPDRRETTTTETSGSDPQIAGSVVPVKEIVEVVTETLIKARATAIVAIAGVAVLGLATITATSIDDGPTGEPAKTSGDSTTSTGGPSTSTDDSGISGDAPSGPDDPTATPAPGDS